MTSSLRLVPPARLHRLAEQIFLVSIQFAGFPSTDQDASALAKDAYRAAALLMQEGDKYGPKNGTGTLGGANVK